MSSLSSPFDKSLASPYGKGSIEWYYDATADDSDKSFTVPAGTVICPFFIAAGIATTATVGNRSLRATISDGTNLIYKSTYQASVTASQTGTFFLEPGPFGSSTTARPGPGASDSANVTLSTTIPFPMYLKAGYVIRVWDRTAVDAAADDLTWTIGYISWTV